MSTLDMTSAERPERAPTNTSAQSGRPFAVLHVLEPTIAGVPAYVDHLGRHLAARGVRQGVLVADREGFERWDFGDWAERVEVRPWSRRS
ncbi:MAG: hypothetical protein OER95_12250, partial [Acidimicrobiia bacterium]|nr:hypothetical protein [Acidimicrobiia bacterium]